jgi:hypothetical protein
VSKANTVVFDGKFYIYFSKSQLKTDAFGFGISERIPNGFPGNLD